MEETKKKEEEKIEFNFDDEEINKSRILKEYPARAKYEEERGRFTSYNLKLVMKVDGRNTPHVRDERLQESKAEGRNTFDAVFQVRENNETKKIFYCWVVTFAPKYQSAFLVKLDEKNYLESFVFKNNKAVK